MADPTKPNKNDPRVKYVETLQKQLTGPQAEVVAFMNQTTALASKIRALKRKLDRAPPANDPKGEVRAQRAGYLKELQDAVKALKKLQESMEDKAMEFQDVAEDVVRVYPEKSAAFGTLDTYRNMARGVVSTHALLDIGFDVPTAAAAATATIASPATTDATMASTTVPLAAPAPAPVPPKPAPSTAIIPAVPEAPMWHVHTRNTLTKLNLGMLHLLHTVQGLLNDAAGSEQVPRSLNSVKDAFAALYRMAKTGQLEDDETLVDVDEQLQKAKVGGPLTAAWTHHDGFKRILGAARYSNVVQYLDFVELNQQAVQAVAKAGMDVSDTSLDIQMAVDDDSEGDMRDAAGAASAALGDSTVSVGLGQVKKHFLQEDYFEAARVPVARPAILMGYDDTANAIIARPLSVSQVRALQSNAFDMAGARYRCAGLLLQPVGKSFADLPGLQFDEEESVMAKLELIRLQYVSRDKDAATAAIAKLDVEIAALEAQLKAAGESV